MSINPKFWLENFSLFFYGPSNWVLGNPRPWRLKLVSEFEKPIWECERSSLFLLHRSCVPQSWFGIRRRPYCPGIDIIWGLGFKISFSTSLGIWMDGYPRRKNKPEPVVVNSLCNFSGAFLCRWQQQTISHPESAHRLISSVRIQSHLLCEQVYYQQVADTLTFAKSN